MDIGILTNQMIQLFLIIFCGYGLFKAGVLNTQVDRKLTELVINVTMPLLILNSVLTRSGETSKEGMLMVLLTSAGIYLVLPLLSFLVVRLLHLPEEQQGVYAFMNTYSNTGIMGFPMVAALYGNEALLYAAVLNILFNLSAYTIGVWMLHYGSSGKEKMNLKAIFNPGMIGSVAALALYFVPLRLPSTVTGAIGSIGGITSPLAMLLIGATLANAPMREMFRDWKVLAFSGIKLIIMPLLIWPILCFAVPDAYIRGIVFVLLIMPVGNTAVLFSTQYGKDEILATKGVFLTTILSIFTIPLVFKILGIA